MAEGVGADPLRDAGRLHRYTDGLLHGMFVDVAATHNAAKGSTESRSTGTAGPDLLTFRVGVRGGEGIGHIDDTVAASSVFLVDALDWVQMIVQGVG